MGNNMVAKLTESDIKWFTKEHKNAKNAEMKKGASCGLKLFNKSFQSKPKIFQPPSFRAAVHIHRFAFDSPFSSFCP